MDAPASKRIRAEPMAAPVAKKLKVAILSSASGGGAGIAARRVTDAFNYRKDASADFIDMEALGERVCDDAAPHRNMSNYIRTNTHFTVEYPGFVRGWLIDLLSGYDALNVHWCSYLISLAELDELSRLGKPILFTLHDFYYITGGCHYPAGCTGYMSSCLHCPQLNRNTCHPGVTSENLLLKRKIFSRPNVHLAAPSKFLMERAIMAGVVPRERAHVLRNAYDAESGIHFQNSQGPLRILLIADSLNERRKGMSLAIDSLASANRLLGESFGNDFIVAVVGKVDKMLKKRFSVSGLNYRLHGRIGEHKELAKVFAECTYVLTCSYEDNWPNILVEAGSYGCLPIVGPGHGCEEFVREFSAGFIAEEYSAEAFSEVLISAILSDRPEHALKFAEQVRAMHRSNRVGDKYAAVFDAIQKSISLTPKYDTNQSPQEAGSMSG